MLKTARAKILFLMLVQFVILSTVAIGFSYASYVKHKVRQINACDLSVSLFSENINKSIIRHQENAKDLALVGEIFYSAGNTGKRRFALVDFGVTRNFENNSLAIGGGLWFEPFLIDANQKRFCRYAFNKNGKVVIDSTFSSEKYDYHTQNWYTTIKSGSLKKRNACWTAPYFDDTGTCALMTTVGVGVFDSSGKFVGMSTVDWELDSIVKSVRTLLPTPGSAILFADAENDFILVYCDGADNSKLIGKSLKNIGWYCADIKNGGYVDCNGKNCVSFKKVLDNKMILVMNVPTSELLGDVLRRQIAMLFTLLLICAAITALVYIVLSKNINKPISVLLEKTKEIGAGNLDAKIEISSPLEFAELGASFNKMTADIREHIKRITEISVEKHRIESELEIAKSIQQSTLPNVFPPYPEHDEFEIFASMTAAKEVGGDFYDFFMVDEKRFAFLIADVSGKGIPAALFMMTTSTLIKNLGQTGLAPDELMTRVNSQICKTNDQDFFVSVFLCVLDISNGELSCVNGGHNQPLICRAGGKWEYMNCKPNLVVGALNTTKYSVAKMSLSEGDRIFLYTDGVTEALNKKLELFGEERLKDRLNEIDKSGADLHAILSHLKTDLAQYADGEPQSDDITMVVFECRAKYQKNVSEN